MIEAAVILWIGLAVGIVGLATTAPNGVALIIRNIRRRIEERVAQLFPSRRTHTNAYAEAADTAAASDSAVAYVKRGVAEDASIEELVEVIGENLQALQDRVEQYEKDSLARHTALAQSVDALRTQLTDRITNLTTRLDEEASNAARTDARGLLPVAFGLVMVTVPSQLAHWSLLGALVSATAMVFTVGTAQKVFSTLPDFVPTHSE